MMPTTEGEHHGNLHIQRIADQKKVLPSDKMAFPKSAFGDISLGSKLALMCTHVSQPSPIALKDP